MDTDHYISTGTPALDREVLDHLEAGSIGLASRLIRDSTGLSPTNARVMADGMDALRMIRNPDTKQHVLEHLANDQKIMAIKCLRETMTILGLKEAKDACDAIQAAKEITNRMAPTPQRDQRPASAMKISWAESGWPEPDLSRNLTAEFAALLRIARRRAGDLSYTELGEATSFSKATISRAFSGKVLPRWGLVDLLLETFQVPPEEVENTWRPRWLLAQEQNDPVGLHNTTNAFGDQQPADTDHSKAKEPTADTTTPTAAASPDPSGGQACEHCGAWIIDLKQHQAWHWTIENQIRRSMIHKIDGTNNA